MESEDALPRQHEACVAVRISRSEVHDQSVAAGVEVQDVVIIDLVAPGKEGACRK